MGGGPAALDDLEPLQLAAGLSERDVTAVIAEFGSLPEILAADVAALSRRIAPDRAARVALLRDLVTDTSANRPYDLLAERTDGVLKVEVKGTTGDRAETIFMTHNEVELHLSEAGATALMIVSRIALSEAGGTGVGEGGELTAEVGWDIESWDRRPLAYRLTRL